MVQYISGAPLSGTEPPNVSMDCVDTGNSYFWMAVAFLKHNLLILFFKGLCKSFKGCTIVLQGLHAS